MNTATRPSRLGRRLILLACAALVACAGLGCERDDTVRGAGSIDVPAENLKFQPTAKGSGKAKSRPARQG